VAASEGRNYISVDLFFGSKMSVDSHLNSCPLASIDRRLEDVHQQWHQAEKSYFEPGGFRLSIQTAIQTLRTVTFVLQHQKNMIPDFDAWYGEWPGAPEGRCANALDGERSE
jgi:hypothetical protein